MLIVQAGDDPQALARLGKELDVAMTSIEPLTSDRGASEAPVRVLWPCGEVRIEDLSGWRIEVSPDFEGTGNYQRARFDKIAERTTDQPRAVAAHLRAQLLLDAGLCLGAYDEAKAPAPQKRTGGARAGSPK